MGTIKYVDLKQRKIHKCLTRKCHLVSNECSWKVGIIWDSEHYRTPPLMGSELYHWVSKLIKVRAILGNSSQEIYDDYKLLDCTTVAIICTRFRIEISIYFT